MAVGAVAISFNSFQVSLREETLLSPLSAEIHYGEFVGILAPSGSGKTCLFEAMLSNLGRNLQIHGGIAIDGQVVSISQGDSTLVSQLDAATNVALVRLPDEKGLLNFSLPKKLIDQASLLLQRVGLKESYRKVSLLSGGEKQRVQLARLLFSNRRIWLADEPFSNLDKTSARFCMEIFKKELQHKKTAGLMTSHDQDILEESCDRLLIWDNEWKSFRLKEQK